MNKEIIIDPSLKERQLEGYYFEKMHCSNCGRPNGMFDGSVDVMIMAGRTKKGIKTPITCPYCECETLNF